MERLALGLEDSRLSKWLHSPWLSTDSVQSLSSTKDIVHRARTNSLQVSLEAQQTQQSQSHPEKEKGAEGISLPDFRLYTTSYSHQNHLVLAQSQKWRSGEQDRSPEGSPCTCSPLSYDKGGKSIHWRKDSPFPTWCWEDWTATVTECN